MWRAELQQAEYFQTKEERTNAIAKIQIRVYFFSIVYVSFLLLYDWFYDNERLNTFKGGLAEHYYVFELFLIKLIYNWFVPNLWLACLISYYEGPIPVFNLGNQELGLDIPSNPRFFFTNRT